MKKIIITGASDGLGKAIAKELRDEELILISRNESKLKELSEELGYASNMKEYKENPVKK